MPTEFKIIPSERLKLVRISGRADYAELEACFYRYIRHPDFSPDFRVLVDLRDLTDAIGGLWEFQKVKNLYQYAYAEAESAFDVVLLTQGNAAYRAARLFAFLMRDRKPMHVRVTKNLDEALQILGVRPEVVHPFLPMANATDAIPLAQFRS